ncbi:hypothetical protein ACHWQZ_G016104 [Mnemiopsis leidyi]
MHHITKSCLLPRRVVLVACTLLVVPVPAAQRVRLYPIPPTSSSITAETLNTEVKRDKVADNGSSGGAIRDSWTPSSTSLSSFSKSDVKENVRDHVNKVAKRSANSQELPGTACKSDNGADELEAGQSYNIFDIDIDPSGYDEGATFSVTCKIMSREEAKCNSWLKETAQNVSLVINGEVQEEESFNKTYFSDGNFVKFSAALNYESHNKAVLSCLKELNSGAKLVSLDREISRVDELNQYTITPEKADVTVGEYFALTCQTDSIRALDSLRWKVQRNDDGKYLTMYKDESETLGLTYSIQNSAENLHSVVNVTREKEGAFKSRIDYNFTCTEDFLKHLRQNEGRARVSIHPVDHGVRDALVGTGAAVLVLSIFVSVFIFWRRRKLRAALAVSIRMTETRNAIMQIARTTSNEAEEERRATDAFMMAIETVNGIMDRISKKHSVWEKDKSKIQIKAQIGEGNFGVVLLGTMPNEFGIIETVAIKTIKEQGIEVSALLDFEKEMEVMATLKHRNIVNLLGICTVSLPFYIIMEYMEHGQLNDYLTKFAPSRDYPLGGLSVGQLAWMCEQPCDALEYLSANNMVHRDVSARNCLVGTNLQVKLADFGLSRNTSANDKNYYKKEGGMVPIKWMAPEALTFGRYTSANDVWAFGILAWEVFSFGALPYQHLTNQQVMVNICKGERLDRPHLCPEGLWEVLLKCWADKPDERIMFTAILAFLKEYSQEPSPVPNGGGETEFSIPHANTTVAY